MTVGPEVTSELRRTLAGAICLTIQNGESDMKRWLGVQLAETGFEWMTDEQIVLLADQVLPEADVARSLHMCDDTLVMVENRRLYLCPACLDVHHLQRADGRWYRCEHCNPWVVPA
jgi:hypothetical protein